ncbi:hypothetical protein SAMN04487983_100382 [Streptomyces sp. yr375]|uniref:DUF7144 family membrane protein n=1 Tax=Streptomyces sp. yr375 TaxID=1761906 RepID=UPI0008D49612|nr:hypothetical protein [Streptomyces sp. yr375]SEQ10734.1 hypothetical protein SAMN04487983_100382 [Streptomyces sp. yr375]
MSPHPPTGDPHGEIGTAWSTPRGGPHRPAPPVGRTGGAVAFAGVLMLCGGVLAVLQGVAAVAEDDVYARVGSYVYELSLTGWGWIHLVLGALAATTGAALLKGLTWARHPGIFLAALSLVAQFLFLPYEPLWSITVMAIDVFVIWSLAASGPQDT